MKEFKNKITKQLISSYVMMCLSDFLMSLLYLLVWNYIIFEVLFVSGLEKINFIQAYAIFFIARLIFNRDNLKLTAEEEIWDSFKRNLLKFIHYIIWFALLKIVIYFYY